MKTESHPFFFFALVGTIFSESFFFSDGALINSFFFFTHEEKLHVARCVKYRYRFSSRDKKMCFILQGSAACQRWRLADKIF